MNQSEQVTRAIDKIKKCLALSKSANEHEAAVALKQAQALMRQFNLTQSGVLASTINRVATNASASYRPSRWDRALVVCVAEQFDCEALIVRPTHSPVQWVFLGAGQSPEIAAYAYQVLLRQLVAGKEQFVASKYSHAKSGEKRKLGGLFCAGWVEAVSKIVEAFAGDEDAERSEALDAYMAAHHPEIKTEKSKKRTRKVSPKEYEAYQQGIEKGNSVRLHKGLDGEEQQLIGSSKP